MTEKESFMFFKNMREVIKGVPREKQLELREAIENYVFDGIESDDWAIRAIVQSLKPSLEYKSVGAPQGNKNNPHGRTGKPKETKEPIDLSNEAIEPIKSIEAIDNQLNQFKSIKSNKQEAKAKAEAETETETETSKKINLTVYTKEKSGIDPSFVDEKFKESFIRWLKYKKDRKELYANKDSLTTCYDKLVKESKSDPLVAETMIEAAIGNNYQGFFPLRSSASPIRDAPKITNKSADVTAHNLKWFRDKYGEEALNVG